MNKAYLAAFFAIILWATLALSATSLLHIPLYFQLSLSFLIGAVPILIKSQWRPIPLLPLAVGLVGILGYHILLFNSFRYIPPVTANLINYLWPILIVLLAPIFQKEQRWRRTHFIGATGALMGFVLLTSHALTIDVEKNFFYGVSMALSAAILWAIYSLLQKSFKENDGLVLGLICLVSGLIFGTLSATTEPKVVLSASDLAVLIWMGLGPFGLGFFFWEWSLKQADSQKIGTLAYLTPVLSTLFLVVGTEQVLDLKTSLALALITTSALVAGLKK